MKDQKPEHKISIIYKHNMKHFNDIWIHKDGATANFTNETI